MDFPLGEVASLATAICWAIGLNLFRRDAREVGARPVNLFKGLLALPLIFLCLWVVGAQAVSGEAQAYLIASGVLGVAIGDSLLFFALGQLGAHRAALFGCLGPALTAVGAWFLLDEILSGQRIAGIALAATGVTMVVYFRPKKSDPRGGSTRGIVMGVLSAVAMSLGVLLNKRGLAEADPLTATALRLSAAVVGLTLFACVRRELMPDFRKLLRPRVLRRLVPAAFIGTFLGLWLMAVGIKHTESAVANALHSTTPLFTLPIALLVLRERVGKLAIAGSFVAVAGVFLLLI